MALLTASELSHSRASWQTRVSCWGPWGQASCWGNLGRRVVYAAGRDWRRCCRGGMGVCDACAGWAPLHTCIGPARPPRLCPPACRGDEAAHGLHAQPAGTHRPDGEVEASIGMGAAWGRGWGGCGGLPAALPGPRGPRLTPQPVLPVLLHAGSRSTASGNPHPQHSSRRPRW
jgi:hypothetical protein